MEAKSAYRARLGRISVAFAVAAITACSSGGVGTGLASDAGSTNANGAKSEDDDDDDLANAGSEGGVTATRDAGKRDGATDAGATDAAKDASAKDAAMADGGTKRDGGGPPPTATGLQGFCQHYFECGGTSYASVQACVTDAVNYWNACRRPELDAFGTCMMQVSCQDWNPAAYDPYATPCGTLWGTMVNKSCP